MRNVNSDGERIHDFRGGYLRGCHGDRFRHGGHVRHGAQRGGDGGVYGYGGDDDDVYGGSDPSYDKL